MKGVEENAAKSILGRGSAWMGGGGEKGMMDGLRDG